MFIAYLLIVYSVIILITLLLLLIIIQRRKRYEERLLNKQLFWREILKNCIKYDKYVMNPRLIKRFSKYIELEAFFLECDQLSDKDFNGIINNNEDVIISIVKRRRSKSLRAYFAYLVANMKYVDTDTSEKFSLLFLSFLSEKSVYLRENSLKAIYRLGNSSIVIRAFEKLSVEDRYHNEKLITDGLMTFTGDVNELNNKLLKNITKFKTDLTEAIIDYWTFTKWHECDSAITEFLNKPDTPIDVICAVVRKLGKNENSINRNTIIQVVKKYMNQESCEPTIVGVRELGDYVNDEEIRDLLLHTITSTNWYVRINSANALVKNGVTQSVINYIDNCDDRYAKDAFNYALSLNGGQV